MKRPPALLALIALLDASGWSYSVKHDHDTAGNAFITVTGVPHWDPITSIRATWHTRATGTLRLFSAMGREHYRGWRDMPVSRLRSMIGPQPEPEHAEQAEPEPEQASA